MDTKLYINKFAIKQNVEFIASKLGGIDKIIAMVKANAYGVGSNLISKYLENLGIVYFGVANTYEGKNLRQNKITSNIINIKLKKDRILQLVKIKYLFLILKHIKI